MSMVEQKNFLPHTALLTLLFVLGEGVLIFPQAGANEFTFTAFILAALMLIIRGIIVSSLWNYFSAKKLKDGKPTLCLKAIGWFGISVFSLFCSAATFKQITSFAIKVMLPDTAPFLTVIIFAVTVVYFCLKRQENILKFSLIAGVITVIVLIFFFIAPIKNYDVRSIFIFRLPTFKEMAKQIKPYCINPLLSAFVLPLYFGITFKKIPKRQFVTGLFLGAALLGLCILSSVLLFTPYLAGSLDFPFSSAASTVSVGRLFTRLDGFAYFVFFVSCLIKITVCVFVSLSALKYTGNCVDKLRKK